MYVTRSTGGSRLHPSRRQLLAITLSLLVLGSLVPVGAAGTLTESTADADGTGIEVTTPEPDELEAGETGHATVTAVGADEGVSAYEVTLELTDDVAAIDGVEVHADSDEDILTDVTYHDDRAAVTVEVALLDATHEPADEIPLFDVELVGQTDGDTEVVIGDEPIVSDLENERYGIDWHESATLSVVSSTTPTADLEVTTPDELAAGETETATVTAVGADEGVSAYELTLELAAGEAATLEETTVHAASDGDDGPLVETTRSENGSVLTVDAALLDATHEPADEIPLFDVELAGQTEGSDTLELLEDAELYTLETDEYELDDPGHDAFDVTETDTPIFDVAVLETETDDEVVPGGELTVTALVTNVGEREGTQTVTATVDGERIGTESLTLDADGQTEVQFTESLSEDVDTDELEIAIESDNDTTTTTIPVEGGGGGGLSLDPDDGTTLAVGQLETPRTVDAGEPVSVSAVVGNADDETATGVAILAIDGSQLEATSVTLEAGTETAVEYEFVAPDEPGEYELSVSTSDETTRTLLTVVEDDDVEEDDVEEETPATDDVTDDATADADPESDDEREGETDDEADDDDVIYEGQPGFGFAPALLVLLGAGYLLGARQN